MSGAEAAVGVDLVVPAEHGRAVADSTVAALAVLTLPLEGTVLDN